MEQTHRRRPGANGGVPFPNEFASIGLPVADRFESTSVFLLNGGIACQLTEHEIRTVLAKGVLMDADALEILCEKGYEKHLGFKASDKFYKQTYGQDLEHPLNYPGKILRDVRQSFGYCGAVTAFTKTNEKAEYLAEAVDAGLPLRAINNSWAGRTMSKAFSLAATKLG